MSSITLERSAVDHLLEDPKIKQWLNDRSESNVPFLGYYRRSYSTARDGTVTEWGDGFMLTTIDPGDSDETRDIVIMVASVGDVFNILVGGEAAVMERNFTIRWSKKFTYEPLASE